MDSQVRVHLIAGARPNFMKIAPLYHALSREAWCHPVLIHTGQHYDYAMSQTFFDDLGLPDPDIHLEAGSGSHARQTAAIMVAYEDVILRNQPDIVIVPGDVNSTLACSVTAKKMGIPVVHLEAGLRSGDMNMPEEVNRIVTDSITDLFLTPSVDADENLVAQGVPADKIHMVGNIMIDSLELLRNTIEQSDVLARYNLEERGYVVVTLHRPSNVDDFSMSARLVDFLIAMSNKIPLMFPVHPRTKKNFEGFGLMERLESATSVTLCPPLGYCEFMRLVFGARFAITDSGGLQEETSYLGLPCLTLRENTERPITVTSGSNRLVSLDSIDEQVELILNGAWPKAEKIPLWDGKASGRIVESLKAFFDVPLNY